MRKPLPYIPPAELSVLTGDHEAVGPSALPDRDDGVGARLIRAIKDWRGLAFVGLVFGLAVLL